jgi:ABC-type oligopeptide transport system substrate-binding subunit
VARLIGFHVGWRRIGVVLALLVMVGAALVGGCQAPAAGAARADVRILAARPSTFDPAAAGDVGAAAVTAQLYESLTAFDSSLALQPALAATWDVAEDGTRVVFHLRPGLAFSDGSPLTAEDVVGSWLRIIDPARPAPLAALMLDVRGARDYLAGRITDPGQVGLRASGSDVEVDLERPGADFPSIVSSPLFGVVPPAAWRDGRADFGVGGVSSGGYVVTAAGADEIALQRNERYWAGPPAITAVRLVHDISGRNPVAAFLDDDIDSTSVSIIDAPWLAYDERLGPQLRETPSLTLTYLGIDTTERPFDNVRVRQAVGAAVDWRRIGALGSLDGLTPATSMVPAAIPGAGDGDWLPLHDPDRARDLLAAAGYPAGAGLPTIHLADGGSSIADAIAAELERELGMRVEIERLDEFFDRISGDPPHLWISSWIADYPGPNDFLGVLLESDSSENRGGWVSPAFDQAIGDALATRDPVESQAAFERALAEVRDDVPAVPLYSSTDWSLVREGLLGAGGNGMGIPRIAGMAWSE